MKNNSKEKIDLSKVETEALKEELLSRGQRVSGLFTIPDVLYPFTEVVDTLIENLECEELVDLTHFINNNIKEDSFTNISFEVENHSSKNHGESVEGCLLFAEWEENYRSAFVEHISIGFLHTQDIFLKIEITTDNT